MTAFSNSRLKIAGLVGMMLCAVGLTYSNHFRNGFHFDDSHTVIDNAYIRSLKNAPLFFTDARTFSVLPANRTYRPMVTLSLALDYWIGRGLEPMYFQVSTFFWYLLQLVLIYALVHKICQASLPGTDGDDVWIPLLVTSLYGLHPAIADTVNYVIQRGEIYSTLGVVAGLCGYAWFPRLRKFGIYLLPVAAGQLSKPPALVFPAILLVYLLLFEEGQGIRETLRKCIPALLLSFASTLLTWIMTPTTYEPGAASAYAYRITQPLVALRYFRAFFLPDQLSADTDHVAVSGLFQGYAWLGCLFVIAVVGVAIQCSKRREWRPAGFGLWWFLIALVPTAAFPLAEIENDHRMFFPFIGLALAVCWPLALWTSRNAPLPRGTKFGLSGAAAVVLIALAQGTWQRNEVWHSDEALWSDVTVKSPRNGRGLMNYGLTQLGKGETKIALDYFERALVYNPDYPALEINLGIANGALNQDQAASQHFSRAIQLAPGQTITHFYYGRWLQQKGRTAEALDQLRQAIDLNPDYLEARYLLMEISAQTGDRATTKAEATRTLERFPSDTRALAYLSGAKSGTPSAPELKTADDYLNLSLSHYRSGRFLESIAAAREALKLKPRFAEAYNNISAGFASLGQWDEAIEAAREALALKPDFPLARNNLAWDEEQKQKTTFQTRPSAPETASAKVVR